MSVDSALQALRLEPRWMRHVVRWEHIPARAAQTAPFPAELDARVAAALRAHGIAALYTHQAAALEAALRGENVAVATPAASGKTLCYNLPVLHRLLADPGARALFLFPTKALAQDQLAELHEVLGLLTSAPRPTCATYDGDTPSGQRAKVRDAARIILSNPDMLHAGILPQHPRWSEFFANLAVVVVDEMHVYRGVFGSHVANVLRRLRRICRFYGSTPQFILASATIANPHEVAERLVEAPVTIVGPELDGAPQGEKHLLFYNPPLIDPDLGIRRSNSVEAANLAAQFLAHDVQTIVFAQSRLTTELILSYLQRKDAVPSTQRAPDTDTPHSTPRTTIRGYRGGYLPTERRAIEKGLREGHVRAVVATNALELGIDIGRLDAAVLAGYPGTIASTRQQLGRAGRRQSASIGVLVAGPAALDQYMVTHPAWLIDRSPEHARLNPDNAIILAGHLACAAAELPIRPADVRGAGNLKGSFPPGSLELLDDLVAARQLYRSGERYFWGGEGSPTTALSLRSAGAERIVIQVTGAGETQVIGELEREGAPLLLYEGAIYLHESASYLVERLDWEGGIAHVRPVEVDFYTRPIIGEKIEALKLVSYPPPDVDSPQIPTSALQITWGDVRVVSQATGYRIQRQGTNEVIGFGQVDLPEQVLETQACRLAFSETLIESLKAEGLWLSDPNDYGPNWPAQRDAARGRDGYRCQGCGQPELDGRQHDVHHKIPFRAFAGDSARREGLDANQAWQIANRLENLVTLCPACHRRAEASVRTRTGLGGAAALLGGVAPLFLMCDPRDLGVFAEPRDAVTGRPTITIYEKTPGGVGYAEQLAASMPELLQAALDTVAACPCTQGCPACVGPVLEHEFALDAKALTQALLEKTLEHRTAAVK